MTHPPELPLSCIAMRLESLAEGWTTELRANMLSLLPEMMLWERGKDDTRKVSGAGVQTVRIAKRYL